MVDRCKPDLAYYLKQKPISLPDLLYRMGGTDGAGTMPSPHVGDKVDISEVDLDSPKVKAFEQAIGYNKDTYEADDEQAVEIGKSTDPLKFAWHVFRGRIEGFRGLEKDEKPNEITDKELKDNMLDATLVGREEAAYEIRSGVQLLALLGLEEACAEPYDPPQRLLDEIAPQIQEGKLETVVDVMLALGGSSNGGVPSHEAGDDNMTVDISEIDLGSEAVKKYEAMIGFDPETFDEAKATPLQKNWELIRYRVNAFRALEDDESPNEITATELRDNMIDSSDGGLRDTIRQFRAASDLVVWLKGLAEVRIQHNRVVMDPSETAEADGQAYKLVDGKYYQLKPYNGNDQYNLWQPVKTKEVPESVQETLEAGAPAPTEPELTPEEKKIAELSKDLTAKKAALSAKQKEVADLRGELAKVNEKIKNLNERVQDAYKDVEAAKNRGVMGMILSGVGAAVMSVVGTKLWDNRVVNTAKAKLAEAETALETATNEAKTKWDELKKKFDTLTDTHNESERKKGAEIAKARTDGVNDGKRNVRENELKPVQADLENARRELGRLQANPAPAAAPQAPAAPAPAPAPIERPAPPSARVTTDPTANDQDATRLDMGQQRPGDTSNMSAVDQMALAEVLSVDISIPVDRLAPLFKGDGAEALFAHHFAGVQKLSDLRARMNSDEIARVMQDLQRAAPADMPRNELGADFATGAILNRLSTAADVVGKPFSNRAVLASLQDEMVEIITGKEVFETPAERDRARIEREARTELEESKQRKSLFEERFLRRP